MENKTASRLAAILLATGIAAGSFLRVSHVGRAVRINGILHVVVHIAAFALLTLLLVTSTNSRRTRWLLFLAVLLFGYGTEFYEHLKDGYPIEYLDVLADSIGAGLAMAGRLSVRQWASRKLKSRAQDA